jgi:hypothetical protein
VSIAALGAANQDHETEIKENCKKLSDKIERLALVD